MKTLNVLGISILLLMSISASAQSESTAVDDHGKVGLRASGLANTVAIELPCWVASRATLAPSIAIASREESGTQIQIGAAYRQYFSQNQVKPFAGIAGDIEYTRLPASGAINSDPRTIWSPGVSLLGGADYFLTPRFSIGVQARFTFRTIDQNSQVAEDNTRNEFTTGSAVSVGIFF